MLLLEKLISGLGVENESYGLRLEKKIGTLQSEIRTLTDHITRHTFVNEANQHKIVKGILKS